MGTIAKGEITLSPVNDAYTVSLTPSYCTITADFDGSNLDLSGAQGKITVKQGAKEVPFRVTGVTKSSFKVGVSYSDQSTVSMQFVLLGVSNTDTNGWIDFTLVTEDGYNFTTTVRFAFTVVREATMLDWIQDWEGSKTKIGDTYLMTPKLFVGKKEDVLEEIDGEWTWQENALTGVYIGPDLLGRNNYGVGIYGYLYTHEIFHINADGGYIGGWTFNEGGLQSGNGVVNILAEGSIYAQNPSSETPYWGIYADGTAQFANGKVKFYANGSAEYEGSITAKSGAIGGWKITETQIYSSRLILDSSKQAIGCFSGVTIGDGNGGVVFPINSTNGVVMYYTSDADFGIKGRRGGNTVFMIGSTNYIAGWNFNHQAIWTGSETPCLTQGGYAANEGELTVAPNGLRCYKWYIDANGTASFTGGSIKFDTDKAQMFGWLMREGRFSSTHAALSSISTVCGLFVSSSDLSEVSSYNLVNTISSNGGIYLYSDGEHSYMRAYDKDGNLGFFLSTSGNNSIGNWNFNHNSIYIGSTNTGANGFTSDSGSMVLATTGLIGYKWKLMADGSGAIANGNISWDASGTVTLANSVTIAWANISGAIGDKLTHIDANGIYTGTISADNVTAGTLIGSVVKQAENDPKWSLNADGSGQLASNNISWDEDGKCEFTGKIIANSGTIGGFEIGQDYIGISATASQESGGTNWANLTLAKDFFKVGGNNGYAMFGDNVIPASVGGAFTAVGRIVNNAISQAGNYGFDQANYGLLINVEGGTKNYGIKSNAALMASAFINTKAQILTFVTDEPYSIDFSQHNVILMSYNDSKYSGTPVTLPSEGSVAAQFGLSSLPDDFATVVTFRVRPGSKNIILQDIYDHNEKIDDYTLAGGDSIQVLISKIDGFRYQILNHSY